MNVGELRALIEDLEDDIEIRVAMQPSYPLRGILRNVVPVTETVTDPSKGLYEDEVTTLWLATEQVSSYTESPYHVPQEAWSL